MKNSWRVILAFSQNSLGKQFRNDLMMLRGTAPLAKTKTNKQTNKQKKQKQNKNKNNKTKQNKTKQKQQKTMFCALSQNHDYQRLFEKYYMHLIVNCPSKELKDSIKI